MHVDESTAWVPLGEQDKELIRRQMNRLLETSHFRNSRRYPALLRFVIEETLAGRGSYLKERLIGVSVFGRPADYDTAADPVVRVTIAEIRKRIAQYYHDEAHDHEMRIELMPGSYEPEFRPGRDGRLEHIPDIELPLVVHPTEESAPAAESKPVMPAVAPDPQARSLARRMQWALFTAILLCVAAVAGGVSWYTTRPTAIEQLWGPLLAAHKPVMLVLPVAGGKFSDETQPEPAQPSTGAQPSASDPWTSFLQLETGGENVVFADVIATMQVSSLLSARHAEARLRLNNATTLDDLRQGPSVLIGGMDNQWTLRTLSRLRYSFAGSDADAYWIRDRADPQNRRWSLDLKARIPNVTRDYALIARIHDDVTGQPEILVAGIGMSGTAAAGEFLVTPSTVEELRRRVGAANFRDRDFEAVLSTDVVNGIAGSAKILTVELE